MLAGAAHADSVLVDLVQATNFALDDGILDTKRKFSDLCEELVLNLGRAEVLALLEQKGAVPLVKLGQCHVCRGGVF